jgi:hypothetical protein
LSLVVFSHANSVPAATYGLLFKSLRSRGFIVKAVDKFGHAPEYPVTNNWRHLVQQLHDFATQQVEKYGEPALLVGHSLGAMKRTQLVGSISPGRVSRRRKNRWPSQEAAIEQLPPQEGLRTLGRAGAARLHRPLHP